MIKSYKEACAYLGYENHLAILPVVEYVPKEHQRRIIAFHMLLIITRALNKEANGGVEWTKGFNEYGYHPYFCLKYMKGKQELEFDTGRSDCSYTFGTPFQLHFINDEVSRYAGKHFIKLYRELLS